MIRQLSLALAVFVLSISCGQVQAERMPEEPKDATHVVTGMVQRIFTRETKEQIQYIVEIKVNQVERPASLKPGELLSVYCFQAKEIKPFGRGSKSEQAQAALAGIKEGGHRAIPKEGQQIRALAKPRNGRLEALYPDWFSVVDGNPKEATQKNASIKKGGLDLHLLATGKSKESPATKACS